MGRIVGYIPPKQAEKLVEVVIKETPKAEKPKKETAKKEK